MATIAPDHDIRLIEQRCEVHFAIAGFWTPETMRGFLDKLDQACMPLVYARKPIYALGDFTGFVTQDQATGEAVRDHLINAQKFGLQKVAIVNAGALARMQYARLSEGVDVEFFDNPSDAAAWLRAGR